MQAAVPSRTALRVALRRAAHQVYDRPLVFEDPYAVAILGAEHHEELRKTPASRLENPARRAFSRSMRAYLVVRSRFAEDTLAVMMTGPHPPEQYLLLGAGLDTFALRNPWPGLRVFEVDHPATQEWKRGLLAGASLTLPAQSHLVAVDFEARVSLTDQLVRAGFHPDALTAVSWLGVVPYLTLAAFRATMAFLRELPAGSSLVFDYGLPRHALSFVERLQHDSMAARVAQAGEPFQLFFTPEAVKEELLGFGYRVEEDMDAAAMTARYLAARHDGLALKGRSGHLLRAVRA